MDKPSKRFVLAKYEYHAGVFVLERRTWEVYVAQALQTGRAPSVVLAESDDREELLRFKKLTEEG